MARTEALYRCQGCGQISKRSLLQRGTWGDLCCPSCHSSDITRHRSKAATLYSIFFLYKVY